VPQFLLLAHPGIKKISIKANVPENKVPENTARGKKL